MEYKLLALDLDGTVFNSKREIDKETIEAIHAYKQSGGKVIICSGRSPLSTRWIAKTVDLADPIIAYNGAVIQDVDGKILYQSTFSQKGIETFIQACKSFNVYGHLYEGDNILVPENNKWNENWIENNIPSLSLSGGNSETCDVFRNQCKVKLVEQIEEYIQQNNPSILKFAAFRKEEESFQAFTEHLKEKEDEYEVSSSWNFRNLEISPAKTSKSTSLKKLTEQLGLEMSEVAAIGDNFNDLHMLTSAGLGVAMGNAPKEIQEAANIVTSTNDELGVAKAIYSIIGN